MKFVSIAAVAIVSALAGLWVPAAATAAPASRPNVVLIMTDNQGDWTLGCYGNRDVRTPHIDQLAAEGTLFTRAFASNPVCSPTRASFLTGLIPSQHGVHSFLTAGRLQIGPQARCTLDQFTSLPEVLKAEGYACGLVGKWHLGDNLYPQEGFDDHWITMPHGGTSTFYDAAVIEQGQIRKEPKYLTDLWTEHAVQFIDQQAAGDEPFFLFLAYNGPYSLGRLLLQNGQNRHATYYANQQLPSFPRSKPHPWLFANRDYINNPTSIRRVATEISGIDDGVGQVMQALQQRGIDENTIVIFVADQGWVGGQGGFFGMGDHTRPQTARDGMMRIPMIWRHPQRIAAGVRSEQMIANYDLMPTLLGQLGLSDKMPAEPPSPGSDFSPLLTGADAAGPNRNEIFYEFESLRCIRTDTHKYVHRYPNGPHELYDLTQDPDEFVNLIDDPQHQQRQSELKQRLDTFYGKYAQPQYDLYRGGGAQTRMHEEIEPPSAQLTSVHPPPAPAGYRPAPIDVPDGYSVELVAAPPLVTHPTMGCFDDRGRLYVCNNAGANMTNVELEQALPNQIRRLVDADGDGRFESSTVFADKMTFPMGALWHDGSLYVASPPNIWRLTDTDDDGVADQRKVLVGKFGYNGNAASIHGCFAGPDGRIYWTDGHHGHEFKDAAGNVTSKREGSYIFSCRPDGSDVQIHCGGGMDNPVEVDFTDAGEMLGTVNILYTRPRVDALVHWLYGGAYPHRQRILEEITVTGDLLGPVHRFGHVAVSGLTRYRSGAIDHRFGDDLFATLFNGGKVVRLSLDRQGATFNATQHEFLSSPSRDFHPTDVLEDADGSLLVIDTGGWFYRGCPTSQFSKPELLGGIYRIRRDGMTTLNDPRGNRIDWQGQSAAALTRLLNDTRWVVRQRAIDQCVRRSDQTLQLLARNVQRGDIRVRQNSLWALCRIAQQDPANKPAAITAMQKALQDPLAELRGTACRALGATLPAVDFAAIEPLLQDPDAAVRREAATTLGRIGDPAAVTSLVAALGRDQDQVDRSEEHAIIYALIQIADPTALRQATLEKTSATESVSPRAVRAALIALDQIKDGDLTFDDVSIGLNSPISASRQVAAGIAARHAEWTPQLIQVLRSWLVDDSSDQHAETTETLLAQSLADPGVAAMAGEFLQPSSPPGTRELVLRSIAHSAGVDPHPSWIEPLQTQLTTARADELRAAIAAAGALRGNQFDEPLQRLSENNEHSVDVQMDALAALIGRSGKLDQATLDQLIGLYEQSGSPTAAARAAQILGTAKTGPQQLVQIAPLLTQASPTELRELMSGFARTSNPAAAAAFLAAIRSADAFLTLSENELSEVIKNFPRGQLDDANELLDQLKHHQQQKLARLESLRNRLDQADADRGQVVFQGQQAKCASCHRVGDQGNRVGPELTTIGANRSASDLLESIVFPSASIVRDYETYKVLTVDGRAMTGLLVSESSDHLELQPPSGEKITLQQNEIEQIAPGAVSIMPAGLDEALSEQELLDVVKYLQQLR